MKPLIVALAGILSLFPTAPLTAEEETNPISGSAISNPTPAPCCSCISMLVAGINDQEGRDDGKLWPSVNGEYQANVTVFYSPNPPPNTVCPDSVSLKVIATPVLNGVKQKESSVTQSITVSKEPSDATQRTLKFTLPAELVLSAGTWEFELQCPGDTSSPVEGEFEGVEVAQSSAGCGTTIEVPLGVCGSCNCASGKGEMNKEGECHIPIGSDQGDMRSGELIFTPGGFLNPGRSALTANVAPGIPVTRDANGYITSITTDTTVIAVTPAAPALLALDPNAFTITHTVTGGLTPFRTTTISFVTEETIPRLRMDSNYESTTTRHELTNPDEPAFVLFDEVGPTFNLFKGRVTTNGFEPLSKLVFVKTEPSPGKRVHRLRMTERPTVSDPWFTSSNTEITYEKQVRGWVQTKEVMDPNGAALTTTWSYYQPGDITGPGGSSEGLGRLKQMIRYDGYEAFHTYGLNSHSVTTPYAGYSAEKVTTTTWDPVGRTSTTTTSVSGNIVSKSSTAHAHTPTAITSTRTVHTSAGETLVTTTTYKPSGQDFGGKPVRTVHPDGTVTTYSYTREADGGYTTTMEQGEGTTTVTKGTRNITTRNARGNVILDKTEAIGYGGVTVMESMTVTTTDYLGRATAALWQPANVTTTTAYNCCGIASETDMYGIKTFYAYDGLERPIKTNRLGVTTATVRSSRQTILNNFEPGDWQIQGNFVKTYRYPETVDSALSSSLQVNGADLVSVSESNLSGTSMLSSSPDPTSATPGDMVDTTTTVTYKPASQSVPLDGSFYIAAYTTGPSISARIVTEAPDGATQVEARLLDGRTSITAGDLSASMLYTYSSNATGEVSTRSYIDREANDPGNQRSRETVTTQSDWAGRTVTMSYMDGASASMHYNSKGQMEKSIDPDGVVTLYAYNGKGERTTTATDLPENGSTPPNGIIDYGSDTVSFSETVPATATIAGIPGPVWQTTSKVWKPGSTSPTTVSTTVRSADGLRSSTQSIGVANPSTSLTNLSGGGNWTTTQTSPDNTTTTDTYVAGLLEVSENKDSNGAVVFSISYEYDSLNRPYRQLDSRLVPSTVPIDLPEFYYAHTTTSYISATADFVKSITVPRVGSTAARTTYFTYDTRGRRLTVNAPDTVDADGAPLTNVTTITYNPDGTVQETSGAQTYRTTHTYDYAQRMVTLTTYGTETATTTWKYSPERGFLTEKIHPGEINNGAASADYTYSDAGRLLTRTWERGTTTTYGYDDGGRRISTDYSDTTPDVSITYDALNRPEEVTSGSVTWDYEYDPITLRLLSETHPLGGTSTERLLTRSYDNLSRPDGFGLGTPADPDLDHSASYGFDDAGRYGNVTGAGQSFGYTYTAGNLIDTVTGPVHTVTNTWDKPRRTIYSKNNEVASSTVSQYTYGVNHIGQRETVQTAGSAFGNTDRGWAWGYDALGQATKAVNTADTALNRAYAFDGIGNRTSASGGGLYPPSQYTPNALNQYSQITQNSIASSPTYDADGNLLTDAGINALTYGLKYEWDAENRLTAVRKADDTLIATYTYDYMSRRIRKTTTAAAYQGASDTAYLYDGWNVVAEYSISGGSSVALVQAYTWGLDLSGSMQGAGGVGGLLSIHRSPGTDGNGDRTWTDTFHPTYDGNGNVSEYLDKNGDEVAHFEYDPFGRLAASTGTPADFTYRFSTKPQDFETGLYYYGYRYYDPVTGRWPSRDPIGEEGGINSYAFLGNDGVDWWDYKGLRKPSKPYLPKPGDEMSPDEFSEMSEKKRNAWVDAFRNRFGDLINKSAESNCVPKKLLAAIIANEMSEWLWPDGTFLDGAGGGGVGPAQIATNTAIQHNLTDYREDQFHFEMHGNSGRSAGSQFREAVDKRLATDEGAVEAAARLIREYIKKSCMLKDENGFKAGFVGEFHPETCKFDFLCCMSCKTIVDADVPPCFLSMMAGVWNNPLVVTADDPIGDNNFPNSQRMGIFMNANFARITNSLVK